MISAEALALLTVPPSTGGCQYYGLGYTPEQRQIMRSRTQKWRSVREEYRKGQLQPNAHVVCSACQKLIQAGEAFALHANAVTLQAEVRCLGCYEKKPESRARYMIVREEASGG